VAALIELYPSLWLNFAFNCRTSLTSRRVIGKLAAFFNVSRNVIFERAWFNCRNQLKGETAEEYIVALYKLAVNCDYRALKSEMISD